jgi:ribosomal protein S20
MKFKGLATAALVTSLTAAVFAAPVAGDVYTQRQQSPMRNAKMVFMHENGGCRDQQDPIKFLEDKKAKIQQELQEGKITKEQADEKISKIDSKIKAIEEFKKLSVPEKKEKMISHFKARLDRKVESGKLDQNKADELLAEFTEKINQWDGTGFPKIDKKDFSRIRGS